MIKQIDVTGVTVYISEQKVSDIINSLPSSNRQFSHVLAKTVLEPHEIWQSWMAHETNQGAWLKLRTYLQYLDISETERKSPFAVSIVQFLFEGKWQLYDMQLKIGDEGVIIGGLNLSVRNGEQIYSVVQH